MRLRFDLKPLSQPTIGHLKRLASSLTFVARMGAAVSDDGTKAVNGSVSENSETVKKTVSLSHGSSSSTGTSS